VTVLGSSTGIGNYVSLLRLRATLTAMPVLLQVLSSTPLHSRQEPKEDVLGGNPVSVVVTETSTTFSTHLALALTVDNSIDQVLNAL
jgi:CBS-domain-containing membrane protein